jgi:winged helix DNA-binding protein
VLLDGFVRGTWRITRRREAASLLIGPLEPLRKQSRTAVAEEGARLLAFAATDAPAHDVQFASAD